MTRWTRERYRKAQHLNRLLGRHVGPYEMPELVRLYHLLWERHMVLHPDDDPLSQPLRLRLSRFKGDDIPF